MKVCKRCLYPENHALNIIFDEKGICSGCRVHEEKDTLDWKEREKKLIEILDSYRNKNETNYDCIIPVSGGKDSYFIVDLIKNKYKMNPLLVSFNKVFNTKTGIRNLQYLKTIFGCDLIQFTMNPEVSKNIVRYTFNKINNMYWLNHLGTTTFPVQIATRFKIPLIIWGVHQGIDQVGMFSHTDEVEMTRKYRKEHDLMGYEALDMVSDKDNVFEKDLIKLAYPSNEKINKIGVRGIYLSNYIRWDSKTQHELMINEYKYETLEQTRTFIPYDNVDCFLYSDVHDYLKFIKLGYSKVHDHVSREIRLGHINIDKGQELISSYKYKKPLHIDLFCSWLEESRDYFFRNANKIKNFEIQEESLDKEININYIQNHLSSERDDNILLFNKGHNNER